MAGASRAVNAVIDESNEKAERQGRDDRGLAVRLFRWICVILGSHLLDQSPTPLPRIRMDTAGSSPSSVTIETVRLTSPGLPGLKVSFRTWTGLASDPTPAIFS